MKIWSEWTPQNIRFLSTTAQRGDTSEEQSFAQKTTAARNIDNPAFSLFTPTIVSQTRRTRQKQFLLLQKKKLHSDIH